ncbi:MAG: 4-demethylwyosine synthase TYW1 [Candidatus Hodarchaeales archaeon]|jgi:tRNA wybutosine-synthesizing protein 1
MNPPNSPTSSNKSVNIDLKIKSDAELDNNKKPVHKLGLTDRLRNQLEKKAYRIAGDHSAVQICSWTKKSLESSGESHCYKQRFYGINCHKCAQMTPTVAWCNERCTFCWRPMEFYKTIEIEPNQVDSPRVIIEGILEQRRKLLIGYKGNSAVDKEFIEDALIPDHWAISLSGEPTMYPLLPELINMLREDYYARSIFLVTNAQDYAMIQRLKDEEAYPTQMYISVDAPNEELFKEINRSRHKDGWERLIKSLKIFSKLPCRRVIRFTMMKGINDNRKYIPQYKEIFNLANADFIEVKSYMYLGYSQKRLALENMPYHKHCLAFSQELIKHIPYRIIDDSPQSRIVLLQHNESLYSHLIENFY